MGKLRQDGKRYINGNQIRGEGDPQQVQLNIGNLAATGDFIAWVPSKAVTISSISVTTGTTITANDTNYWSFSLQNKAAAGSGTTEILSTTSDANTTKATGGSTLTANVDTTFAVNSSNANVAASEALKLTVTKAASATDFDGALVTIKYYERDA